MTRLEQGAGLLLMLSFGWAARDVAQVNAETRASSFARSPAPFVRPTPVPPPDAYAEIVSRSLFMPSRRADFSSVGARPGVIGGHILRGVVSGAAGDVAVFEPVRGGPARRLRAGSAIGGYRIAGVEEAGVIVEREGEQRLLAIDQTSPSTEPQAPLTTSASLPASAVPDLASAEGPLPVMANEQ